MAERKLQRACRRCGLRQRRNPGRCEERGTVNEQAATDRVEWIDPRIDRIENLHLFTFLPNVLPRPPARLRSTRQCLYSGIVRDFSGDCNHIVRSLTLKYSAANTIPFT